LTTQQEEFFSKQRKIAPLVVIDLRRTQAITKKRGGAFQVLDDKCDVADAFAWGSLA
jgi:hypothetical protein